VDLVDLAENRDQRGTSDTQDIQDNRDPVDHLDSKAVLVQWDRRVYQVVRETGVHLDQLVVLAPPVELVRQVYQVQQDHRETVVDQVLAGSSVLLAQWDLQDHQVRQAHQARQDRLARKVRRDQRAIQAKLDAQASQGE